MSESRPRVLFVGRTRYRLPLPGWLAKKFDALERQLYFRVVASAVDAAGRPADERFRLLPPLRPRILDGILFYVRCPFAVRRQIREFHPEVVVAESPYTGMAALLGRLLAGRPRPRILVEVHGDWRTATRLYGNPNRRILSPPADWVSRLALRRGDAVRAVSPYTAGLVEEVRGNPVTATFPTYTDLSAFSGRPPDPLPERPVALFVGMLEYYKNIDGLAAAWRTVAARLPAAKLVVVGEGARRAIVEKLVADLPDQVEWIPELPPQGVAEQLDRCTIFVLPSRSEGLPRVLMEAFARGRGAIGGRAGGIPELVHEGVTGLLVDPEDVDGLATALTAALSDGELAARFGEAAHRVYRSVHTTPAEYASRVRELVDASLREAGAVPGERPRVLIVGRRSYAPGDAALVALREEVDYCVLGRADSGTRPRSAAPAPGGIKLGRHRLFYLTLPFRTASVVRRFRPRVVIAETPHLGFLVLLALAFRRRRNRPALIVETYADWRATARLRGSRLRLLLAPLADWAARYALRRADALRAASPFTAGLAERAAGVPPVESFPGYIDLHAFVERPTRPLPERPSALFVGMLERSKDLGMLASAWRLVAPRVPDARLVVIGRGALEDVVHRMQDDDPDRVEHVPEVPPAEVARRLDEATLLVLPSRSEGFGRVIIESFTRGRPVVATRVGGIPDLVENGVSGLLVPPGDSEALADALTTVLADRALAERLSAGARRAGRRLRWTPDDYAARVRGLVDRTLAAAGER
jgi:glycosyltransferase involved in cell wall biosynthesis